MAMAQISKIEAKADIKCPAAKVYNFFKNDMNKFTHLFPQVFKAAQLLHGEEGQPGNVKSFDYVLGKPMSVKIKAEAINEGERSITFSILEGDILQLYNSFSVKLTCADGCANWSMEFEKANESGPNPDEYVALAIEITKGLDAYLLNSN